LTTAVAQPVIYVDAGATGAHDGSSWADAFTDLQAALDAAEASGGSIQGIWVAAGTYRPSKRTDPDDPRSATFQLLDGVSLYGGFAGTEASIDERDIDANPTILSGDFNGDDEPDFVNYDENAYHVVLAIDIENSIIFDGLTVTGGHAPGPGSLGGYGGGMHLENAYPEIRNCTFSLNLAEYPESNVAWSGVGGAALFLRQPNEDPSRPPLTVSRSRFVYNHSSGDGGAVFIYGSDSARSVVFSECSFEFNHGLGAISAYLGSEYTFRSCTFSYNSSTGSGGAIATYFYGADLLIDQCRFKSNTARSGGAIDWRYSRAVTIYNSVFVDNSAESDEGGAVSIYVADKVELVDSVFDGNRSDWGGGASLVYGSVATVRQCQFLDNDGHSGQGGGLYLFGWDPAEVIDCIFVDNLAGSGGGLFSEYGALLVEHSFFTDNRAGYGGGLASQRGKTLLIGCSFTENSAREGGGLRDYESDLTVIDSTFERNRATTGGGVFAWPDYRYGARFERCRLTYNSAYTGGGVAALGEADFLSDRCEFTYNDATIGAGLSILGEYADTGVTNSLFAENSASAYGGGIAAGAGTLLLANCTVANNTAGALGAGLIAGHDTTVTNSIVWGNVVDPEGAAWRDENVQFEGIEFAVIDHSDVQGWSGTYGGEGNTGLNPSFVTPLDPDGLYGPGEPDFHLRPESPCINAGLTKIIDWGPWYPPPPNLDLDGKPRVLCALVDMGAYESGLAGDVDCDRDLDMTDFSEWSVCMGGPFLIAPFPDCSAFDFDGDEDVDLLDFARFVLVLSPDSP